MSKHKNPRKNEPPRKTPTLARGLWPSSAPGERRWKPSERIDVVSRETPLFFTKDRTHRILIGGIVAACCVGVAGAVLLIIAFAT